MPGEDIVLETNLSESLPRVKVDPSHLDQVIMNLAINSRDAMPNGGSLMIETSEVQLDKGDHAQHTGVAPGHYVMLAVSDTGIGMDEATRARAFEPFFTTKDKGKGTGLGLSIVYGIVKQNGGEVLVNSQPGEGTQFRIYLPASQAEAEPMDGDDGTVEMGAAHETVLLVEDEEQVRSLATTMLARRGYHVLSAANASDAIQLASMYGKPIHLLLTDVIMPGMRGPELAREIVAARPGTRVLYMSGYTDHGVINQGMLSKDTVFLRKPFTASTLHQKVREALG